MSQSQDKTFLGTEPIGKLLLKLAIPTVVAQLVNMLYNIVDRIYIGHMPGDGALALTGVGVCMPVIMIISAFAAFIASGGAPRASIFMGKQDHNTAEKILGGCFSLQIVISLALTAVLLIWGRGLLMAFGASENTIEYAVDYMMIYALGTIFVQLTLGMNAFITAQGFASIGMWTVLIGAVINIALDPLFIFTFKMGVQRRSAGHRDFAECFLCLGAALPDGQKNAAAAEKGNPVPQFQAGAAVHRAGQRGLYHAVQRKRDLGVLQFFAAQIRRGCGRGRDDDPDQCDAVRHAAPAGHCAGRTAHHQL